MIAAESEDRGARLRTGSAYYGGRDFLASGG
jgi:hypothetical protein